MHTRFLSLVLFLATVLWADVGWAREWVVERVAGTAWSVQSAEARTELKVGMAVAEGVTIATSKTGRVRLSRDNNVMTLGPASVAAVRPKAKFSSKTEVIQKVGSIEFDIEKRARPHFSVETPFMAAVVKGTVFTISVTKTDTRIGVDRGLVQVQDLRTGETAGVAAGQSASVSSRSEGLRTAGPDAPAVSPGQPSAPSVAPVGQTLESFRAAHAAESARTGVEAPSRSFGFGVGTATSTNDQSDPRSNAASGFGGFGGGLSSNGGDRDADEATGGLAARSGDAEATGRGASDRDANSDGPSSGPASDPGGRDSTDTGSNATGNDGGNNGNGQGNGGGDGSNAGGNGQGNGGGDGSNAGGNGQGNNGNGQGNGGGDGSNAGGNGKGNNGNGQGNGGGDGSNAGGNGKGNNGNGQGNGGGDGSNAGGNGQGNNGNGQGNGGGDGSNAGGNGKGKGNKGNSNQGDDDDDDDDD